MPPVPSGGVVKLVGLGSTFGWIENWLVVRSERDLCVNRIVILDYSRLGVGNFRASYCLVTIKSFVVMELL
ncbi:hypothetical protein Bca4012_007563 [Brassica carinata]|uniref:BnaC03g65120D protein n=3 Tax=Brassica TaxID=3705 RepID=A0A078HU32_BRANA|nr:hypothetical protein HID58_056964 [Brassica napus]CAF1711273.1 unnamed protein product [Brassica napus]CDY41367.1 BnaC03g65120D [Brassica napus]VDC99852.1 unnamed protein product [Brassica oleracea]